MSWKHQGNNRDKTSALWASKYRHVGSPEKVTQEVCCLSGHRRNGDSNTKGLKVGLRVTENSS